MGTPEQLVCHERDTDQRLTPHSLYDLTTHRKSFWGPKNAIKNRDGRRYHPHINGVRAAGRVG